jgi:hypothetical protein
MNVIWRTVDVLRIFALCTFSAIVGCRDDNGIPEQREQPESQAEKPAGSSEVIAQFRSRVKQLTGMLDAGESRTRWLAYDLCKETTASTATNIYETLTDIYVKAAKNISFDIEHDAQGGAEELSRLDARLRNLWSITEWAVRAVFYKKPESMEGWEMLSDVLLKHRKAASWADSAMSRLDMNERRQFMQHRRLGHFKREMETFESIRLRQIGWTYESLRHRLTPEQRASIVHHMKSVLGRLPDEMKRDMPSG